MADTESQKGLPMASLDPVDPTKPSTSPQISNNEIPPPEAPEEPNCPTGLRFWIVKITIAASLILGALDFNIVATAVPAITDEFHTVSDVGWYISAFRLCCCAFQFIFGKAYKLFPVRTVFLIANALILLGSLLCGVAVTSTMLVVGRAVAGVGAAGLLSGAFAMSVRSMPLHKRPFYIGLMVGIESLAIIAGPLLGGVLTESLGWRWCFYINLPVGVLTFFLACFFPANKTPATPFKERLLELDLLSNMLIIPALTSLFIALSWAGTKYPWSDGKVIGPLVTFFVLMVLFALNQVRRGDKAALPPRILKNRSILAGALFMFCTSSEINVLEYYLPTYYQIVRGYSPAKSGYLMIPIILGASTGAVITGSCTGWFGYYVPSMITASVVMPIASGLITTFGVNTSLARMLGYTLLSGFGNGIGFSGPTVAAQTVLSDEDASLGLSVMLFAQSFGPAVSTAIAQVLLTNQLSKNLHGIIPGLNSMNIEQRGLSDIVKSAPGRVDEVLLGVSKSLSQMWYLVVALSALSIVGSLSMEWLSVKKRRS